jgi:hypothetical protein
LFCKSWRVTGAIASPMMPWRQAGAR